MNLEERLRLAQEFVVKRDKAERERTEQARECCRNAFAKILACRKEVDEILQLYSFAENNNIPVIINGYNGFHIYSEYGVAFSLQFNTNRVPRTQLNFAASGVSYSTHDYEDVTNCEELYLTLGLFTAFSDLFPNFKLTFYEEFDRAIGLEKGLEL